LETGLVHVLEGRGLFPELTVLENHRMGGFGQSRQECEQGIEFACEVFPRIRERLPQKSGSLSGGEQQMLVVGRALVARPRVLLLDEISLGLSPRATAELYAALATIRTGGICMLVVEQQAHLALANTDRVYVLRQGRVVLEGPSSEFASDPSRIWQAYTRGEDQPPRENGIPPKIAHGKHAVKRRKNTNGSHKQATRIVVRRSPGHRAEARKP
jgi:ABC-type branched-subunit amino acid transport system ATPase component